jgi:biopolymer transport protein ExbD
MSAGLRRRSVLGDPGKRSGPMMTPMVDVVLVILIFFMASTTIAGYEWFLQAGVESESTAEGGVEEARFALPDAVIDVDLVRGEDGVVLVYGVSGDAGLSIDQAATLIGGMEIGDSGALRVGLGAGDGVSMGDVMRVHDAWHGRGVKVVMRTGR